MSHLYRRLDAPAIDGWSALAFVSGENVGPGVSIEQCERCALVRVSWEGHQPYYSPRGMLTLVEPDCRTLEET